jgi:hypothetical protein
MLTNQLDSLIDTAGQIVDGEYDRSIQILIQNLTTLKAQIFDSMGRRSGGRTKDPVPGELFEIQFLREDRSFTLFSTNRDDCQNAIPMFCEPLVVRCEPEANVPPEALAFATTFNLALAYQLKYWKEEARDTQNLCKAAGLYQCSHELFQCQSIDLSPICLMILVTNLASIHQILGEEQRVEVCLKHTLSVYMFLIFSHDGRRLPSSLLQFINSVMPFLLPKPDLAPAA